MSMVRGSLTNQSMGYPADARLLIVNADDFGMCHAVNEAIVGALKAGIVRSTSLMVPCPSASQAIRFLSDHPEVPFGVHLTAISDSVTNRWRPMSAAEEVPSLLDKAGYFYDFDHMPEFMARVRLDELEMEFRAQIEVLLAAGLQPTHLDWHSLRIRDRADIFEVMFRLAREYGLALRIAGRSSSEMLRSQGLPSHDHDVLDSYLLDPATKAARFAELLRALPIGLSEWAVHPGFDSPELLALEPGGNHIRQADLDFLTSQEAQDIVREEGIVLLDYRALQAAWKAE
ncbi:MAG: polysaccharide deacetylase family protein [Anaerolineae bacterium]|nr:polysaccharide deacetylase family protein [Anaerolineae bacterium]